jgi:hypothetical protein
VQVVEHVYHFSTAKQLAHFSAVAVLSVATSAVPATVKLRLPPAAYRSVLSASIFHFLAIFFIFPLLNHVVIPLFLRCPLSCPL